jgi:membrane-bound serine protease (ClpP class)
VDLVPATPGPRGSRSGRRGRVRATVVLAVLCLGLLSALLSLVVTPPPATATPAQEGVSTVGLTEVTGTITPVTADHLVDTVADAAAAGHEALIVRLDTPGGLVDSTRIIVQAFLDAPLPVVVHVAPSGSDAGSAGTFITYAAHVAAMAPATTIGAATPVGGQGEDLDAKILENTAAFAEAIAGARDRNVEFAVEAVREGRSVTADVALARDAIDLIVPSTEQLLEAIDGTEVEVRDSTTTLATAGAEVVELEVGTARTILGFLADPNLAFIFLSIGTLAIIYEIASPGLGLGGAVGAVSIILGMMALAVLPVNVAGIALLLLAGGLFIAEVFAPGIGAGAGGGSAALVLASIFLFPSDTGLGVDLAVVLPTVIVVGGLTVVAGRIAARSRHVPLRNYDDDLAGRTVRVRISDGSRTRGQLDGAWWQLRPTEGTPPLRDGDEVTIVGRDNLALLVTTPERAERRPDAAHGTERSP